MTELKKFIAHARDKGMDHGTIRALLLSNGWKERDIAEAMTAVSLDQSIPMPPDSGGARDAFFHLLSFAALYTLVISTIVMFFHYIDRLFPDPAEYQYAGDHDLATIRWSMAAVIVAFPLLIWMAKLINADMRAHPEKSWSGVRRWLTYLTLFIAAFTLMINGITLIFSFLEGELTTRFLSKVILIFVCVGLTFTYYFYSLKHHPKDQSFRKLQSVFLKLCGAIVLVALVWGGLIAGTPVTGRLQKLDETRLNHLREIKNEIHTYVYKGSVQKPGERLLPSRDVPSNLHEVVENAQYRIPVILDPETGYEYEYRQLSGSQYELCAEFTYERQESYDIFWNHSAGRDCFTVDVLEDR